MKLRVHNELIFWIWIFDKHDHVPAEQRQWNPCVEKRSLPACATIAEYEAGHQLELCFESPGHRQVPKLPLIRRRLRRSLCRRRLQRHHSKERATVLSPHNKQRATSATCKLGQFNSPPAELSEPGTNHLGGGGPYSHCCMVEDQAGDWRGRKPVTK